MPQASSLYRWSGIDESHIKQLISWRCDRLSPRNIMVLKLLLLIFTYKREIYTQERKRNKKYGVQKINFWGRKNILVTFVGLKYDYESLSSIS